MKHLFTFFVMLIFYQSYAQDMNWYIKNRMYMANPLTNNLGPMDSRACDIFNVSHPHRWSAIPVNESPRNDLFIIFTNGNHFNSRYLDLDTEWIDWPNSNGGSGYHLKTSFDISHLYYTNVYEDDDDEPTARVAPYSNPLLPSNLHELSDGSPSPSPIIVPNIPSSAITSNHSPVPGTDLTLIIDHSKIDNTCTYNLCYTICDSESLGSHPFSGSNIFSGNSPNRFIGAGGVTSGTSVPGTTSLTTNPSGFDNTTKNCIKDINFDNTQAYTYVNLYLGKDPDTIISNCPLVFALIPSPRGCGQVETFLDTIKTSHDPNYIEVKCVNRPDEGPTSTIRYYVQCMNDGNADQPDPSIELTFPFTMDSSNVIITNASIRSTFPMFSQDGFNNQAPEVTTVGPNRVKFQFCGNLDYCPPLSDERNECKAWVEFCVKVPSDSVNVLEDDIRPFERNTNFGDDPYIIERYIPLPCDSVYVPIDTTGGSIGNNNPNIDSSDLPNKDGQAKSNNDETKPNDELISFEWICLRQNTDCSCTSFVTVCSPNAIICDGTINNWTLLICLILAILAILWMLRRSFRKRSKG